MFDLTAAGAVTPVIVGQLKTFALPRQFRVRKQYMKPAAEVLTHTSTADWTRVKNLVTTRDVIFHCRITGMPVLFITAGNDGQRHIYAGEMSVMLPTAIFSTTF